MPMQNHESQKKNSAVLANAMHMLNRILIFFASFAMFLPAFNPARISERINRDVSLFTTGVSFTNLTLRFERAFIQGWVDPAVFIVLTTAAIALISGTILSTIGACMSLGNNRMRLRGHKFPIIGGSFMLAGLLGVLYAHSQLVGYQLPERLEPVFPSLFPFYMVLTCSILGLGILTAIIERRRKEMIEEKMMMAEKYSLFLMFLPIIVLIFLFNYLPLWGWRYAFFDYTAGGSLNSETFSGWKWFTFLFENSATLRDLGRVMRNTLVMSGLGILTSWLPVVFAISLNELRSTRLRRLVQTFTTIPNFISWVLIYGIALAIFSTDGFLNSLLGILGSGEGSRVNHLMNSDHIWLKMLLWGTWKSIGWSAIIYIAAIAGIDPQLYEAATIDGAGRVGKIWHIVVPGLMPTYLVLLLLSIGGILSNGLEQYLVFQNPLNQDTIEVLDLYVYNIGINEGRIPLSTVVSMAKSLVSVALLFGANRISKMVRGETII